MVCQLPYPLCEILNCRSPTCSTMSADADGLRLAHHSLAVGRAAPVTGSRSRCGACIVSAAGRPLAWGVHRSLAPNFEGNAKCKARERAARALSPFACLIHSRVAQVADIHAEADALAHAARAGVRVAGASCYVTKPPCVRCAAQLAAAGIVRCGYSGQLRAHFDERVSCAVEAVAQAAGMALVEGVTLPSTATLRSDALGENGRRHLAFRPDLEADDARGRHAERRCCFC